VSKKGTKNSLEKWKVSTYYNVNWKTKVCFTFEKMETFFTFFSCKSTFCVYLYGDFWILKNKDSENLQFIGRF